MKKYHLITFGCQMNKNDSERMAGLLENIGYEYSEDWKNANLVLLNTCSIRDKAERRVLGKFHELNNYRKKKKKEMELVMMGCMPQHTKKLIQSKFPFLDYVVGVNNMEDLPNMLGGNLSIIEQTKKLRIKRRKQDVLQFEKIMSSQVRMVGKKAWISIQFGCNKVCSYCIVPYTRGREISRKKEDIFNEIASLEKKDYNQIVLLGQNVNSYGLTIYQDYDFADLLDEIATKFTWINKIDFLTSYPSDVTTRLVQVISKYSSITNEIHLPMQHGDDEILKKMDRHYTMEEYMEKIDLLRKYIPKVRIGTDLIVGFPGENEQHFQNLLTSLKTIKFDFAHTAAYSPRPGTKATRMVNQVDEATKKKRLQILNYTLNTIYQSNRVI